MTVTLPWPPSVNRYYRSALGRVLISAQGRAYREIVCRIVTPSGVLSGRLGIEITTHQPDLRTRDLDNVCKAILDSLQHAKVYDNDGQIDRLVVQRGAIDRTNPRVEVEVVEL